MRNGEYFRIYRRSFLAQYYKGGLIHFFSLTQVWTDVRQRAAMAEKEEGDMRLEAEAGNGSRNQLGRFLSHPAFLIYSHWASARFSPVGIGAHSDRPFSGRVAGAPPFCAVGQRVSFRFAPSHSLSPRAFLRVVNEPS